MPSKISPRVSVVLPVRDAVTTIGVALASIGAQTFRDWELIVVDDGSVDGTAEVLGEFGRAEPRLRVIRQQPKGVAAAFNAGIEAARGDCIARMDADDESRPDRLAEQIAFLDAPANRATGVVGSLVEFGGDRTKGEGYARHVDWLNSLVTSEEIALNRFVESPLANPSVMFRRELVTRHGGCREGDFPEDYELWLRWLDAGVQMAKVPRVLLRWNDAPTRLTRTDARYAPEAFFRMKAEWIAQWLVREFGGGNSEARKPRKGPGFVAAELKLARPVWIWGAGRHTRKRAAHLETHGVTISGYIDVDAKKVGRGIGGTGLPVIGPEALPPAGEIVVLSYVTTRGAREYNREKLMARGYVEGRDFMMCG